MTKKQPQAVRGPKKERARHGDAGSPATTPVRHDVSRLTDDDVYLFNEGSHFHLYEKLGAHAMEVDGDSGTCFAVWAPDAVAVAVMGDFNGWSPDGHPLAPRGNSGIWEGFVSGVGPGSLYKYHVHSRFADYKVEKTDPFGFAQELSPKTASAVTDLAYDWGDAEWMEDRARRNALDAPMSTYELHLGSWMRVPEEGNRSLSYREMADRLVDYLVRMGFTHVEMLPVMEHPYYASWGYQCTGYFAPTARYGTPHDLMFLIDRLHQAGIAVILDWVPSHFPTDEHGPGFFDGTHLYEHADPRLGIHPDWKSYVFNYGRKEVQSFLISSAFFWLDRYHADGLRVDAVASMLYLDYSREDGDWIPNTYGGNENLEAIDFLRRFNSAVYEHFPGVQTIAEESTAWPMVSRPTYVGGLGFGLKWDMGWMHDSLRYISKDPVHRRFHHNDLSFRMIYAFNENFVLPLSHDEVVHGKGSLLGKMPGDDWQKRANLRALLAYMYTQPGKKLLFMGAEVGQWKEWNHDDSVAWHLLERPEHRGIQQLVANLNRIYRDQPALHQLDCDREGFAWIDANDSEQSVVTFLRSGRDSNEVIAVACNFTPMPRTNYRLGVPLAGRWSEILNTDAEEFGGSGQGNLGGLETTPVSFHGHKQSLLATLPPLAAVAFKWDGEG